MSHMKTAISLEEKLFRRVNKLAEEMHVSRSKLIRLALEKLIKQSEEEELVRRIREANDDYPDEEDKAFLEFSAAAAARLEERCK